MPHFEDYLKPSKEKLKERAMSPERAADLKRKQIAAELEKGPPYDCSRKEGKRMGIYESMQK
jgi:hypothetical protein